MRKWHRRLRSNGPGNPREPQGRESSSEVEPKMAGRADI